MVGALDEEGVRSVAVLLGTNVCYESLRRVNHYVRGAAVHAFSKHRATRLF